MLKRSNIWISLSLREARALCSCCASFLGNSYHRCNKTMWENKNNIFTSSTGPVCRWLRAQVQMCLRALSYVSWPLIARNRWRADCGGSFTLGTSFLNWDILLSSPFYCSNPETLWCSCNLPKILALKTCYVRTIKTEFRESIQTDKRNWRAFVTRIFSGGSCWNGSCHQ